MEHYFKKIVKQYKEDIEWNDLNAAGKMQDCAKLIQKYQELYFSTLNQTYSITEELGKKYQELYLMYKLDFDIHLKDTEIKNFIETNKEYLELKTKLKKFENMANFFEECIKNINSMRWDIKTWLEIKKFQEGIV